jgi:hypothetical protein
MRSFVMGSAITVDSFFSSEANSAKAARTPRATISLVGRRELTLDELEVLEFRCQALQARADLDAMRMEELMRD